MIQLASAFGSKTTRGATFMAPCPACHKRRQARQTWFHVDNTVLVVCPACAAEYDSRKILEACEQQGWVTICEDYNHYGMSTKFLKGVTLCYDGHS